MIGAPMTRNMVLDAMTDLIETVRQHATGMNRKWGHNRLPHVVPLEWTERFRSQKRKWEAACFDCTQAHGAGQDELEAVKAHGEAMLRAYAKLDEIATASGVTAQPPEVWSFELDDGTPIALVRSHAEVGQFKPEPGAQVWCLDEIGKIVSRFPEIIGLKQHFPEAEVVQLGPSKEVRDAVLAGSDDIPW